MARMVPEAMAALGGPDVLVNNAGISGPTASVDACGGPIAASALRQSGSSNRQRLESELGVAAKCLANRK